jgi:hypothetical protein
MRSSWAVAMAVIVLLAAGLSSRGSMARAEDPVERASSSWRFDVRVVRVTTQPATVETAPAFPAATTDGVSTATWPELLAVLKNRGTIQLMLDRNATGSAERSALLAHSWTENYLVVRRADNSNTFKDTMPSTNGVEAKLTVGPPGSRLNYEITVRWGMPTPGKPEPTLIESRWIGDYSLQGDGTLVLRHAEQNATGGTELYVLITWDAP